MEINYNVEIPKSEAEDINALYEFVDSEKDNMKITYENCKAAISRRSVLAKVIDRNKMPVEIKRIADSVFVSKR